MYRVEKQALSLGDSVMIITTINKMRNLGWISYLMYSHLICDAHGMGCQPSLGLSEKWDKFECSVIPRDKVVEDLILSK